MGFIAIAIPVGVYIGCPPIESARSMAAAHILHRTLWLLALLCFVHSASGAAFGRREGKPQYLRDAPAMRRRRRVATLDSSGAPIFKYFLGVGNSLSRYWYFRALARCSDKRFLVESEKFDRKTKRWWSATFLSKLRLDVLPRGSRSGCAWPAVDDARFPHTGCDSASFYWRPLYFLTVCSAGQQAPGKFTCHATLFWLPSMSAW